MENLTENKKQLEILIFENFRQCKTDFPSGRIVNSESPDFILSLNPRNKIGIELTHLYPVFSAGMTAESGNHSLINQEVVTLAGELFGRKSSFRLLVKVLFSEKMQIADEHKVQTAVLLAALVENEIHFRNRKSFFSVVISGTRLPKEIERVLIINHPVLQHPVWESVIVNGRNDGFAEEIYQTLKRKGDKLYQYRQKRLNEYWLLITTNTIQGRRKSEIKNLIEQGKFQSEFHFVFLFDLLHQEIHQIV